LHYCVANMPGAYAYTSTLAMCNATLPYAVRLATLGVSQAAKADPALANGINTMDGAVTCSAVAEAQGLPFRPLRDLQSEGRG
ncbi:MAG: alanine dehydrogenase, partial [Elusimicrobia bacterium]|nr:alanine dehydrogenase [Elusimicrobiota bacterium]